ncbi:MAG TPA: hypothetical protein VII45_03795, partial [Solirubrobacterales bacterium]
MLEQFASHLFDLGRVEVSTPTVAARAGFHLLKVTVTQFVNGGDHLCRVAHGKAPGRYLSAHKRTGADDRFVADDRPRENDRAG